MLEQASHELRQIIEWAPLIVAMPFLVGFAIILFLRHSKTLSMAASIGTVLYGFIHSLLIFYALTKSPTPWQRNFDWFASSSFHLSVGVLVDNLAAMMLIVVTSVSLLVQIYTHGYMRDDPGYSRFYAYLSLFTGSMLGLVVSTNLFQMYMFWELVGVCSYFLIGFWWYKTSAAEACLKAFLINRIGDFGFLLGILLFFGVTREFWGGHVLFAFLDPTGSGFDLAGVIKKASEAQVLSAGALTVIGILMFCGPMAKSAQMPLHVWLPDAMEGPTPISALIHAATMVAAGVYLVARAYPIWLNPDGTTGSFALTWIAWVGGATAFMAATIAMSQYDIKRVLAWSTVSQLGYMFVGLGAGGFTGGLFHLFNHAFFKAMLFLCSGAVIHGLAGEQDIRHMGGLQKTMKWTGVCFLIGTLSISGCPGLSGFFSKDEVISAALHLSTPLCILMIITAGMTAFYMFRLYFLVFGGEYRGNAHPHESPPVMVAPLLVLAVPSLVSGYVGFNPELLKHVGELLAGKVTPAYVSPFSNFVYFGHPHAEGMNGGIMMASIACAGAGAFLAWAMYSSKQLTISKQIVESKNALVQAMYRVSFNKWYWDELYLGLAQKVLLPAFQRVWTAIDMMIVDNLVNLTSLVTVTTGEVLKYSQNGRGQYYALIIFAWVAGLTIFAFTMRP